MANNPYKLQLRSHKEVFATRDLAIEYINTFFAPDALVAEPTLYFYGDPKKPSPILAFGVGNRRVSILDADQVKEMIKEINDNSANALKISEEAMNDLISFVNAVGVERDTNRISNRVTFTPNRRNQLLADATSIVHALDILSEEISKITKDTFDSSDSIEVVERLNRYTQKTDKVFEVKVSGSGSSDHRTFNNNIIGIKNDGLYATSDLEYDEDKNTLTFISSGYKNGQFYDDAKEKVIKLKQVVTDTEDIMHGKRSLASEIDALKESVIQLGGYDDDTRLDGSMSDTVDVSVEDDRNGGQTVSAEVRLSRDNSIIVSEGGLSVNIGFDIDERNHEFVLTVGDRELRQALPDVNIIRKVSYNTQNKSIVVELVSGKTPLIIPVADMLTTWNVHNELSSPVKLTKNVAQGAGEIDKLSASLKIKTTNNLLGVDSVGNLYVDKDSVKREVVLPAIADVTQKTDMQEAKIAGLEMRFEGQRGRIEETEDKADALKAEVERLKEKNTENKSALDIVVARVDTLVPKVETVSNKVDGVKVELDNLKNGSDSRIQTLEDKVNSELPAIKNTIALTSDEIRRVNERVDSVNLDIPELRKGINETQGKVGINEHRLETIESVLPLLNDSVNEFENNFITVNSKLETLERNLGRVPTDIEGVVETENPAKILVTQSGNEYQLNVRLDISNHEDNLLLKKNGTLFVSKDAKDHTATWDDEKVSLQSILNKIAGKLNEQGEVARQLNERMQAIENKLLQLIDFGIYQ